MGNWEIDFKKFLVGKNSQTQNQSNIELLQTSLLSYTVVYWNVKIKPIQY
jgi:hypothetical protein